MTTPGSAHRAVWPIAGRAGRPEGERNGARKVTSRAWTHIGNQTIIDADSGAERRYLISPRTTRRNAASTCLISSLLRRSATSLSRWGSTAAVYSTSTRVCRPSRSTSGRKLAANADVAVGATSRWTTSEGQIARRPRSAARTARVLGSPWTAQPKDPTTHAVSPCHGGPCAASARSSSFAASAAGSARSLSWARRRAASISAERRAFDTVVPSLVSTARARSASSSGRK